MKYSNNWYKKNIESGVRDLVKYLRDNGINTECSCHHDMYIQCQYICDGTIQELHKLLYSYFYERKEPITYTINIIFRVIDGLIYSSLDIKLKEKV